MFHFDPFICLHGIGKKGVNDPNRFVALEIEKRRPHWRRERIMAAGRMLILLLIILIAILKGWISIP